MALETEVRRVPAPASSAHFADPRRAASPEGAEVADALAAKLGCGKCVLIGCLRASILRALRPSIEVVGIDRKRLVAEARELQPQGRWLTLPDEGDQFPIESHTSLGGSLLVVDARLLLADGAFTARLRALMTEVLAAVVIDPDGGLGMESLGSLLRAAERGGLKVEHRSLVRSPEPRWNRRDSPLVVLGGRDPRVSSLLATGTRGLALDPYVDVEAQLARPARVCVASYEVTGPTRNAGIGTANTSLALALARAGHDVTLLFTGASGSDSPADAHSWERHYARHKVRFETLGRTRSFVRSPHPNVRTAYELYAWLRERDGDGCFDIVHFPDCQGHGYYAVLARRQGIAFADTLFVAGVHSSTRWCAEANGELPRSIDALVDEHLERVSVELADVVVSPSAYMLDYLAERGWRLPARRFVQQYVLPPTARTRAGAPPRRGARRIEEVVFFGRLEARKGVVTFCDALDRIATLGAPDDIRITFLGRPEHIYGEPSVDYLARRAARWPWSYELLATLDQQQAMAHLRRGACLAVMPSTVDNSPNTVSEALSLRIPIVASRSGGTGELIEPLDLADTTFPGLEPDHGLPPVPAGQETPEMSAGALADRILAALQAPRVPRFAIDPDANEHVHVGWTVGAVAAGARRHASPRGASDPGALPAVTVGVLHRDDGDGLMDVLTALAEDGDQLLDVVVVDDASTSEAGRRQLAWAAEFCRPRDWTVVARDHRHAGAAREQMIVHGRGALFVFLRASETLTPGALARLRDVASRTGADVLTWPTADPKRQYGESTPAWTAEALPASPNTPIVVPLGGPSLVGLIYPALSSGPYAISRAGLERVGGFAKDARDLDADQDLLNRALLAGCSLHVIPEPLSVALRADAWASVRGARTIELGDYPLDREQAVRIARPFRALAGQLSDLPGLQLTFHSKTATERLQGLLAFKELDNTRHAHAEYINYLESEHRRLSASIQELKGSPTRRLRALLRRLKRKLLA
ncbi:MAG: glycosyltransferase [Solirubrobacterales bacterium]|nr:glycosyltransferase [Solirubrobacterales bacterium]